MLLGAGMVVVVVVVVTCRTSTARSDSTDAGVVSVSRFSNEVLKAAIAFRMPSGKGPDRDSAQYCSIRRSFASTFSTVFMSSSAGAVNVAVGGSVTV